MKSRPAMIALAPAALLTALVWPVMVGRQTWYLRDLFGYHFGAKSAQAAAMRLGFLPLIDPLRAGGQSLVGNLNNVPLYPDNLLYLAAPTLWAFNAHLWIHLLLAPVAMYWLARQLGLEREASWAAGFCYALSGFFLSLLNLYNLIAGAALAPAFAAACLVALGSGRARLGAAVAGALWGLTLLSGDPIPAGLALLVALSATLTLPAAGRHAWARLAMALALGTLAAAPQLVELARILGSSYRGSVGFSTDSRLTSSFDPRLAIELLIPLFYGPPDQRHWGELVLGTAQPLYYSLYPGLIATALALASGRPRSRVARWAWCVALIGGLVALGGWNPLMYYVYRLPLASGLRYPIKAWLLVAIGFSVLAGIGFERAFQRSERRPLAAALAAVGLVGVLSWLGLWLAGEGAAAALAARLAPRLPAVVAVGEVVRWRSALLLSALGVAVALALVAASRRRPRLAGAGLLTLHVASQLVLLRPLLATDDTRAYRVPPAALAYIEPGERVAHGCPIYFHCDLGRPGAYPDWSLSWIERRGWLELHPFAAAHFGLRSVYNVSPEGLDSSLVYAGGRALRGRSDREVLRLLAAAAVDVVVVGQPIDPGARELVRLRARLPSIAGEVWIYQLLEPAAEARVAEDVWGGDVRGILRAMLEPDFDPVRAAFLPGRPEQRRERVVGEASVRSDGWERIRVTTRSDRPGLLVLGRAWQPQYRAAIDGGTPARVLQANLGQLAVEVPSGDHEVEVWADRRPFVLSVWVALAACCGLLAVALRGRRDRASC